MNDPRHLELRRADVEAFWSRPMEAESLRAAREKYEGMATIASWPADDPARTAAIRRLARAFPGALREAELTSPSVCEARLRATERPSTSTRRAWCERPPTSATSDVDGAVLSAPAILVALRASTPGLVGSDAHVGRAFRSPVTLDAAAVAVTLWLELHVAIADVVQARTRLQRGGIVRDMLVEASEQVRARWPRGRAQDVFADLPLRPRTAYLWLAWQAGLDVVSLHHVLFSRVGSWALRADDPSWAHPGSVPASSAEEGRVAVSPAGFDAEAGDGAGASAAGTEVT